MSQHFGNNQGIECVHWRQFVIVNKNVYFLLEIYIISFVLDT